MAPFTYEEDFLLDLRKQHMRITYLITGIQCVLKKKVARIRPETFHIKKTLPVYYKNLKIIQRKRFFEVKQLPITIHTCYKNSYIL